MRTATPSSRRLLFLTDFDSTLTTLPTMSEFLSVPPTTSSSPLNASRLAAAYSSDVEAHKALSKHEDYHSLEAEVSWQKSLRPMERASFFRGVRAFQETKVTRSEIWEAAGCALEDGTFDQRLFSLRRGWRDALETARKSGRQHKACILSVAWSPDWIRGVLAAGLRREWWDSQVEEVRELLAGVEVVCNDVLGSERQSSMEGDGAGEAGIYVSSDKLRVMNELESAFLSEDDNSQPWTVYAGDSLTDLECLLAADVGIVIKDEMDMGSEQRSLNSALRAFDISIHRMRDFGETQTGEGKVLWWARNFEDVVDSGCLNLEGKIFSKSV